VVFPSALELRLLHYKHLGEAYLVERSAELGARTPNHDRNLGVKYFHGRDRIIERHRSLMREAAPVPGLSRTDRAAVS
jgi:hypothetical protein